MILSKCPDRINHKETGVGGKPLKYIGYWHSRFRDPITGVVSTGYDFKEYEKSFGPNVLPNPWDYVNNTWDVRERHLVCLYLGNGDTHEGWFGGAKCRFGCKTDLGCRDLTDGTFVWPEGFAHYIEVHGVKPPEAFLRHMVMRGTI